MAEQSGPGAVGVRRLTPEIATLFEGTFSLLHCHVKGDDLYRGVFAVRLFPVRYPERFISLRVTGPDEKDREIGVIADLSAFPRDQQELIRRSLAGYYHEYLLQRIYDIRHEYGLLFFDVETDKGRRSFVMPWRGDRAEEYGERGKVLLDALDNRYLIPDLERLPSRDRERLAAFIYW